MSLTHRARRSTLLLASAFVAVLLTVSACGGSNSGGDLVGIVREPRPVVGASSLPDASRGGEEFPFRASSGNLLVLYFGYTTCPDVCPTTMAFLRHALEKLGPDAANVEVAMATIDPARDTAEKLTAYIQTFVPSGHALRTEDPATLRAAADAVGADYTVKTDDKGKIEVAHTAFLYVIDDQGVLQLQWPFGITQDDIRSDLRRLLDAAE